MRIKAEDAEAWNVDRVLVDGETVMAIEADDETGWAIVFDTSPEAKRIGELTGKQQTKEVRGKVQFVWQDGKGPR